MRALRGWGQTPRPGRAPLRTKPTAHCSAVENLIVRLVEHPEECFADPLALVQGARGMKVRGLEI